jgi:hypothetical protein
MGEPLGNGCALICEHSPCKMEMSGNSPEWDKCSFYNHADNASQLRQIMEVVTVAPKAFWPRGATSWAGMKFGDWFKHVMGREFP